MPCYDRPLGPLAYTHFPKQRPHHAHAARCTNHRAGRIHVCNLITARTGKHTCSRCWPITALVNNNIPHPHLFVNYNTPHPPSPVRPIRQSKAIGNESDLPQCPSPSRQAPQCTIATHAQYHCRLIIGQFLFRLSPFFWRAPARMNRHRPLRSFVSPLRCCVIPVSSTCPSSFKPLLEVRVFLNTTKLRKHATYQVLTSDSRPGSDIEVVRCIPVSSTCP
jgi:hypothetical protein